MRALGELISLGCRLAVAAIFLYAAHDKVWWPAAFAADMARYDLLPLWAINSASVVLAWLELVIGLLVLVGWLTRAASLWATLLLIMFTGLMVYAGFTGAGFDCGCFPGDVGSHPAGFEAAGRDALFLLAALWLLWKPGSWLSLGNDGRRRESRLL